MKRKALAFVFAAAALIAAGIGAYLVGAGSAGRGLLGIEGGNLVAYEIRPTDRVQGEPNAPITIIEYASLTCSACGAFQARVVPELKREYVDAGKAKLVFRDFAVDAVARVAAACAHCFEGTSYFSFVDLLLTRQGEWIADFDQNGQMTREDVEEGLSRMGRIAGMSRERVVECMANPANLAFVDMSYFEAMERYNVHATPTLIINGRMYVGLNYPALKEILDRS
jgi:hypothetical protein